MKNYLKILSWLFLIFGIVLRLWMLDKTPISLFGDEIDVGLQAKSIIETGKDYLGNSTPVIFHSFSEYRLPMQIYISIPFVLIFGLSEWGVRLGSALIGIITLWTFYLMTKELFDRRLGVMATIFLTISPWHIQFSRQANDAGILLPFVILGTYFFVKTKQNYRNLLYAVISFSLGMYAYAISSLFIPLYFLSLFVIYRKSMLSLGFKKLATIGALGILLLAPYIKESFLGTTTNRISAISFYDKSEVEAEVINDRQWVVGPLGRVYYNKATVVIQKLFESYSESLSPSFLFSKGDPNMRHGVEGFGQIYHFDFVLVLVGLILLGSRLGSRFGKSYQVLLAWLLFAPLPSAFTENGGTHASRLILMLPPLIFLSATGFLRIITWSKKFFPKLAFAGLILYMLFDVTSFFHSYFVVWRVQSWRFWQSGFRETIQYVSSIENDYERILLNNNYEPMLPRFLFWSDYDMSLFQKQFITDVPGEEILPGFDGFALSEKYYFGNLRKPIENLAKPGTLIVASGEEDVSNPKIFDNPDLQLLKVIYSPDEYPIFYIFTAQKS